MRRTALLLVVLAAVLGVVAAGCGGEQEQTATPETVEEGTTTTEPTDTQTTETDTETTETDTETTETETTETETTTEETVTTPAIEGDPAAGKEIFLGSGACGGCHTLADAGTSGTVGPNLDESMPDYELSLDRVTNGQGGMPSFSATLSEQQLADVATYVSSVAGQ
jgi:cytochrome c553